MIMIQPTVCVHIQLLGFLNSEIKTVPKFVYTNSFVVFLRIRIIVLMKFTIRLVFKKTDPSLNPVPCT